MNSLQMIITSSTNSLKAYIAQTHHYTLHLHYLNVLQCSLVCDHVHGENYFHTPQTNTIHSTNYNTHSIPREVFLVFVLHSAHINLHIKYLPHYKTHIHTILKYITHSHLSPSCSHQNMKILIPHYNRPNNKIVTINNLVLNIHTPSNHHCSCPFHTRTI